MPRPSCFTLRKALVSIVWEAGWAPGPVWTGVENLATTGVRSPDSAAHKNMQHSIVVKCEISFQKMQLCKFLSVLSSISLMMTLECGNMLLYILPKMKLC